VAWRHHKSRLGFSVRGHLSINHNDRRAASRRGYNDDAWIRAGLCLLRRCRVLDLSRTGVRLTLTNPHTMPDSFTLLFSKNSAAYPAVVKWRRHNQIGAEYSLGAERSSLK
jgi:hypothetical protein